MGTWISHLRIAENLLTALPGLDELAFSLGSLAPDSGVPNADWSVFDPPKAVTHFLAPGEDEGRIADLDYYRRCVAGQSLGSDPAGYSYRLAYFFHLVSDNLWNFWIDAAAIVQFADLLAAQGAHVLWTEMKRDWYDLDHKYVRDHPGGLFQRVIRNAVPLPAVLDFLPQAAVAHQLAHIQRFYGEPEPRTLDRPYPYLNAATMDRYVADATRCLLTIHRALAAGPVPLTGSTALQLFPAVELAPYSASLGDPT
jgi:hypothetical protein